MDDDRAGATTGWRLSQARAGELVGDLDPAELAIGRPLEGGAPALLPAVGDREDDEPLRDEPLVERR